MKRKIAVSVLFVTLLVSCTAARAVIPAQDINLEELEVIQTMTYLAEDIDIGDGGLLSGQPCPSPCGFGIQIGETQLDQVIPVLEENGISGCWTEPNVSWSLISCGGNRINVQVEMQTRLVNAIWFDPSAQISLGELVEKYGEPNYVTMDQVEPDKIASTTLSWNSIRMLVSLPEIADDNYDIEQTTEVKTVSFLDKNLYRVSDYESNPNYQPWTGYGPYRPAVPFPTNVTPVPTVAMTP